MPWLVNHASLPFVLIFGAIMGEVILQKVGMLKPVLLLVCAMCFTLTVAAQPQRASPARGLAQEIVGAWNLEARTVTSSDGSAIDDPVLGHKPLGRLFYDASGVMMLQMMRQGRSTAMSTPTNPKDAANPRIVLGYDAYFGRYTVDERAGTVTHHVEGSLFPEDLGDDWVRPIRIQGDTLTLRFTSTADGPAITRTLTFRRAQ
jgi:lipocalin-like protein